MSVVAKEMTVDELRALIQPSESMDLVPFDAAGGEGRFELRKVSGREQESVRFVLGDRDYGMKREAYLHFASLLGVPSNYAAKTPMDIMLPHMNFWLHAPEGPKEIGFGAVGGTIQTFSKGVLRPYSNYRVLDVVEKVMGERQNVYHVSNSLDQTMYSFITDEEHTVGDAIAEARARELAGTGAHADFRRGLDILHTGISIVNSYSQSRAPEVAAYVRKLTCTNGAISTDNVFTLKHRNTGDDGEFDEWLEDAIEQALAASTQEISRIRDLTGRVLEFGEGSTHLSETMDSIFAEFSVPNSMRKRIQDMIINRGVSNMYDVYNIITDVGSNSEEALADPKLMLRLQRTGGEIAMHPETCGGCHRILPA